jgi:hypothetical protein
MMLTELKTAAEVREHARLVQRRINERRASAIPEPPARVPVVLPDEVPVPAEVMPEENLPLVRGHPTRAVFAIAGDYFGFTLREVTGNSRTQRLVLPRQIACFIARRLGASLSKIGRAARRDHTTVLHGAKTIEWRVCDDEELADAVDAIGRKVAEAFGACWRSVRADR